MIKQLDERHKRLAEMIISGKPRTMGERAQELGVDRTTCYTWMKDDVWRKYFEKLCADMEAARMQRLLPLVLVGADALECALHNAVKALRGKSPEDRAEAPGLKTLTDTVRVLVELERVDRGKPSNIKESRQDRPAAPEDTPRRAQLLGVLDRMLETAEPKPELAGDPDPNLN